jgi:hypothetical protein
MNTPPPAANNPRLTSGRPKTALSEATITSQPSSTSNPPATAVAFATPQPSSARTLSVCCPASMPGLGLGGEAVGVHGVLVPYGRNGY